MIPLINYWKPWLWDIEKAEVPDDSKKARYLRKADSVNAVIKGIIVKIIPTLLTTTSALARLAFPASGLLAGMPLSLSFVSYSGGRRPRDAQMNHIRSLYTSRDPILK